MSGDDALPSPVWELRDGSRVVLSGKVDRVDLYDDNGTLYMRVVDYKSGKHEFKLDDVHSGLDIQLVLYLFAALSSETNAQPAGALFLYAQNEKGKLTIKRSGFYVDEPQVSQGWEQEKGSYTKGLAPKALAAVLELENSMKDAVTSAAERILAGEAQKTPSEKACKFCPIRTTCDKVYHE